MYKYTLRGATKMYSPATFMALAQRSFHNDQMALETGTDSVDPDAENYNRQAQKILAGRPGLSLERDPGCRPRLGQSTRLFLIGYCAGKSLYGLRRQ